MPNNQEMVCCECPFARFEWLDGAIVGIKCTDISDFVDRNTGEIACRYEEDTIPYDEYQEDLLNRGRFGVGA